jgi:uncharacterized 2Fe-2S/4Fe-4S cluster protein (DUF4445 family)
VVYLIDLGRGETLGSSSRINAQVTLGVDVISRIKYCTDIEDGFKIMQEAIVTELNSLITILLMKNQRNPEDILSMVVTGNTTMLHLFAGISPVTMGYLPFAPVSTFGYYAEAGQMGLVLSKASVFLPDCISSFVGGDITTAILYSGLLKSEETSLLLDIGTNGEVVLGNIHGLLATSTAAGPAF